jgi:hypothetical protein
MTPHVCLKRYGTQGPACAGAAQGLGRAVARALHCNTQSGPADSTAASRRRDAEAALGRQPSNSAAPGPTPPCPAAAERRRPAGI